MTDLETASLHISLPEMLDLALGAPEVELINLKILHNFLHVLLNLNNLKSTKVEYRGEDASKIKAIISSSTKDSNNHDFYEYSIIHCNEVNENNNVNNDEDNNMDIPIDDVTIASPKSIQSTDAKHSNDSATNSKLEISTTCDVEQKKDSKSKISTTDDVEQKKGSESEISINDDVEQKIEVENQEKTGSVIFEEPILDETARQESEQSINKSQSQCSVREESTKHSDQQTMTENAEASLTKRLDINEQNIEKLSIMLQDYMKNDVVKRLAGGSDMPEQVAQVNKEPSEIKDNTSSHSKQSKQSKQSKHSNKMSHANVEADNQSQHTQTAVANEETHSTQHSIQHSAQHSVASKSQKSASAKQSDSGDTCSCDPCPCSSDDTSRELSDTDVLGDVNCNKMRTKMMNFTTTLEEVKDEICCLKEKLYEMTKAGGRDSGRKKSKSKKCMITVDDDESEDKYVVVKPKKSDIKPVRCSEMICDVEESLLSTIKCIDERFKSFEDYVTCSIRNINDIISKDKSEEELIECVKALRAKFDEILQDVTNLKTFKCTQLKQNDTLQEQIDVLKIVKADSEWVEEALALKADLCELNKKVSHEQFDAVCDELTSRINNLMEKLNQQEAMWQRAIVELRYEFDGKIEDLEVPAFKDYVSCELQAMKNKIRILCEIKREQEAAGARKQLREMRCISCDKESTLHTHAKLCAPDAFPCRPTTKPYLTFKMDQVRKQQRGSYEGKNLLHLEKIISENGDKSKLACPENCEVSRIDICNRYCGGSHTVTNPHQRVNMTKPKSCVEQWNMQDLQLVEGFIEGTDGKMYKGRWVRPEVDQSKMPRCAGEHRSPC